MKKTLLFVVILAVLGVVNAAPPVKTHTATLDIDDVCDGTWSDFGFQVSGYDDQDFTFYYTGITLNQDLKFAFRLAKPVGGPIYTDVANSEFTAGSTSLTWSIAHSNIPPTGVYFGELLAYDSASTNVYRSLAQGKLNVTWSLYLIDADYFETISRTNAQTGQVYVHPNWITPPWVTSTGEVGQIYATWTEFNALSNTVDGLTTDLGTVSGMVDTAQSDIDAHELLEGTNVHGLGTMSIVDDATSDGTAYARQDGGWTSVVFSAGYVGTNEYATTNAYFQGEIDTLTAGAYMHRYSALSTTNEEIYVVASTTNVTAARVGTTITMTIPSGTLLTSMRIRWNGSLGSSFTLDMGTNDMANAGLSDRWGAVFAAYREDTGALIAGAQARLDVSNHDRLTIQGLWTGGINHVRIGF